MTTICPDCRLEHDVEPCTLAAADCDCCRAIDREASR